MTKPKANRLTLADVHADTVSVVQTADITGVSKDVLYEAIRRGEFPHRMVGGRIVIPVALLREWLGIAAQPVHEPTRLQIETKSVGGPTGYVPGASRADY